MIKKFDEFVNEGIFSQMVDNKIGRKERDSDVIVVEGVDNEHSFTDMNGVFHKHGYIVKEDGSLIRLVKKLMEVRGKDCDLNDIDISNFEDLDSIFSMSGFSGDVSGWDTSNVKNLYRTFLGCVDFDCDLSKWNTEKVESTRETFAFCREFTGKGLKNWKLPNDYNLSDMFYECNKFNEDISFWGKTLPRVKDKSGNGLDLTEMFYNCKLFDKDLSSWEGIPVDYMRYMFFSTKLSIDKKMPYWYLKKMGFVK